MQEIVAQKALNQFTFKNKDKEEVASFLQKCEKQYKATNKPLKLEDFIHPLTGMTPFHWACLKGCTEIIEFFLSNKCIDQGDLLKLLTDDNNSVFNEMFQAIHFGIVNPEAYKPFGEFFSKRKDLYREFLEKYKNLLKEERFKGLAKILAPQNSVLEEPVISTSVSHSPTITTYSYSSNGSNFSSQQINNSGKPPSKKKNSSRFSFGNLLDKFNIFKKNEGKQQSVLTKPLLSDTAATDSSFQSMKK